MTKHKIKKDGWIGVFADRRKSQRRSCHGAAKIQFAVGSLPRDCTITDISEGGVRVIAENLDVPAEFTLILSTGRLRLCRLAWRIVANSEPSSSIIWLHLRRSVLRRRAVRGHRNMRKASSALFGLCLAFLTVPDMATAGAYVVAPGIRGIGYAGGFGYARLYGHPFDDGYDYPFGYGEYAEYGPWAYRPDAACYAMRRVWTSRGWRQRAIWVCD